jgi:chromosome segregation ATPase
LGGKVDGLLKIKKQLEKEKYELKLSKKIATDRYARLKEKILEYEALLKEKDEEIVGLKEANNLLSSENKDLKQHADSLKGTINDLSGTTENLKQKIQSAATLKASNLSIQAIAENGKIRTEAEYKAKHIFNLRINFKIDDNKIAEKGLRKIIVKIIDANGTTQTAADNSSASFAYAGATVPYSTAKEIQFNNDGQLYNIDFKNAISYTTGRYMTEIYCEGMMIGSTTFVVK